MCTTEVCEISWEFSLDTWEEIIKINVNGLVWLGSGWDQIADCNDHSACIGFHLRKSLIGRLNMRKV